MFFTQQLQEGRSGFRIQARGDQHVQHQASSSRQGQEARVSHRGKRKPCSSCGSFLLPSHPTLIFEQICLVGISFLLKNFCFRTVFKSSLDGLVLTRREGLCSVRAGCQQNEQSLPACSYIPWHGFAMAGTCHLQLCSSSPLC